MKKITTAILFLILSLTAFSQIPDNQRKWFANVVLLDSTTRYDYGTTGVGRIIMDDGSGAGIFLWVVPTFVDTNYVDSVINILSFVDSIWLKTDSLCYSIGTSEYCQYLASGGSVSVDTIYQKTDSICYDIGASTYCFFNKSADVDSIWKVPGTDSVFYSKAGINYFAYIDSVGSALPPLTSGSVLFSDGSTIAQDNANLFWDDGNNRLGLGNNTPSYPFHFTGNSHSIYFDNQTGYPNIATYGFENTFNAGNGSYTQLKLLSSNDAALMHPILHIGSGTGANHRHAVISVGHGVFTGGGAFGAFPANSLLLGIGNSSSTPIFISHVQPNAGSTGEFWWTGADNSNFPTSTSTSQAMVLKLSGLGTTSISRLGLNLWGTTPAATLHIKGEGATAATSSLIVHNSSGANYALKVGNDGRVGILESSPDTYLHITGNNVPFRGQLCLEAADIIQTTYFNGATQVGQQYVDIANGEFIIAANNMTGAGVAVTKSNTAQHGLTLRSLLAVAAGSTPNHTFQYRPSGGFTGANTLGVMGWQAFDGSAYTFGASILSELTGAPSAGNVSAGLDFYTNSGSASTTKRMRITNTGNLLLATTATAAGTSATKTILVESGTAPGSNIADAFQLRAADITAGNAVPWFYNENGDIVKLYPVTTYTQTYSTAASTVNAYTTDDESASYTGIDNSQIGTVYATVADLNQLRVAYETLRASYDNLLQVVTQMIDDKQLQGLAK